MNKKKEQSSFNTVQEVSRAHSTKRNPFARNPRLKEPYGKERIRRKPLPPAYVSGFIDGEGSFSISIGKNRTMSRGIEIRPEFEIEVRADDREILERILVTIGCGKIYDCSYERYGWYPHLKYKITSSKKMEQYLFPFLDAHPLYAKKAEVYTYFKQIVIMFRRKQHLSDEGFETVRQIRAKMRALGKKQRLYFGENR